ncbi:MAG: GNAT family N-acetyltransferase [Massilia sp.]
MLIRRLVPADAVSYQTLRLQALRETPTAFSSSYEEERDTPITSIAAHMAPDSGRNRFGAFDGDTLVGVVGLGRETAAKLRHKAFIGGMYVAPGYRAQGLGRQLMAQALALAAEMDGVLQIELTVTQGNAAALFLYKELGFVEFGCAPAALMVDGTLHDVVYLQRPVRR